MSSPNSAMNSDERGVFLLHLLLNCAHVVSLGDLDHADACLSRIFLLGASPSGDTVQRLAATFASALSRVLLRHSFPGIFLSLSSSQSLPTLWSEAHNTMSLSRGTRFINTSPFFKFSPFLKLAHVTVVQSILEAMEGELVIHVIDLHAIDPSPWMALLKALSVRPGGSPHLRITGVCPDKATLDLVASALHYEAEKLNISFQFRSIVSSTNQLDLEKDIPVKTGEAIAVSSVLHLHQLLNQKNKAEEFMAAMRMLNPKITIMVEHELSSNGGTLKERFMETLNYYAAMFDCLEFATLGRGEERERVERNFFGEEIAALIAEEERCERMENWGKMMESVGFKRERISNLTLMQARRVIQEGYGGGYGMMEDGGGWFKLCWHGRALFSISSWGRRPMEGRMS